MGSPRASGPTTMSSTNEELRPAVEQPPREICCAGGLSKPGGRSENIPIRWIAETAAQTFTQCSDLRCCTVIARVCEKKLCTFSRPADINRGKQTLADFLVHEEAWQQGQSQTRQGRVAHHDAVIDAQCGSRPDDGPASADCKSPISRTIGVENPTVSLEVLQRDRSSSGFEIVWRSNEQAAASGQPAGNQASIAD